MSKRPGDYVALHAALRNAVRDCLRDEGYDPAMFGHVDVAMWNLAMDAVNAKENEPSAGAGE